MDQMKEAADLQKTFDTRRRGVTDQVRLAAAELQNITDVLLEMLKELRLRKP